MRGGTQGPRRYRLLLMLLLVLLLLVGHKRSCCGGREQWSDAVDRRCRVSRRGGRKHAHQRATTAARKTQLFHSSDICMMTSPIGRRRRRRRATSTAHANANADTNAQATHQPDATVVGRGTGEQVARRERMVL